MVRDNNRTSIHGMGEALLPFNEAIRMIPFTLSRQ
jgi:hypothetical protein